MDVMVPAGALAQVWRDGRRQVSLGRLLKERQVHVADLDENAAKDSGELCRRTGTRDVIDASVVVCARGQRGGVVLTGDSADIRHLDGRLEVQRV
jgi:hypothetical protein